MERDLLKAIKDYEYLPLMMYDIPGKIINHYWEEYSVILYYYASQAAANRLISNKLLYKNAVRRSKNYAAKSFGIDLFKIDPKVENLIKTNVFRASETTKKRVDKTINENLRNSYQEGGGINKASKNLRNQFTQLKGYEATRIARTEINSACNEATFNDTYIDENVTYYQWWTARDERVRSSHRDLHGLIVKKGDVFPNGLSYPGDKMGPISEWINCRCTLIPYIIPPGFMAPTDMQSFRESDLIPITTENPETFTVNDIKHNKATTDYGVDIEDFDKYSLTDEEKLTLSKLQSQEKLGFLDKTKLKTLQEQEEFNLLNNKKLTGELTDVERERYSKLVNSLQDKFKSQVQINLTNKNIFKDSKSLKLTEQEATRRKELLQKMKDRTITPRELAENSILRDKQDLGELHEQLIKEGLDNQDSEKYIEIYNRLKKPLNLPKIDSSLNFTTKGFNSDKKLGIEKLSSKFNLNNKEQAELYKLEKIDLIQNHELTATEAKRLSDLQAQKTFNELYSLRLQNKGLDYEENEKYLKLYDKLSNKLNLNKDLLKPLIKPSSTNVQLGKVNSKTKYLKLKGTHEEGLPTGKETIDDLFTVDVRNLSIREQNVIKRYTGNDYRFFRDYIAKCGKNKEKFIEFMKTTNVKNYKDIQKDMNWMKQIANSIEYDTPILENIIYNNYTKVPMILWRTEEHLHMGSNPKVGDIIPFKGLNSSSITKKGMEYFGEISHRNQEWVYEIEAPNGTRGAYIAPLSANQGVKNFKKEMEYLLKPDTKMQILKLDETHKYVKLRIVG